MLNAGLLDDVMGRIDDGGLQLTGEGGFLPEIVKAVLERGLQAELSDHLGYDKGDPAGRGSPNSRNGSNYQRARALHSLTRRVTWPRGLRPQRQQTDLSCDGTSPTGVSGHV